MENVRWGGLVGGILMIVGSFLPWAEAGLFSVAGISGDGVFTLIGGVLVTVVTLAKRRGVAPGLLVTLIGLLGVWIVWTVMGNFTIRDAEDILNPGPGAGTGLFVTGLGSFIGIFAGIDIWRDKGPIATAAP